MNNSPRYPQRVRNDLRFRELAVLRVERISAGFQRIVLGGEALDGFTSRGFDDHSKLFFPQSDAHLHLQQHSGHNNLQFPEPLPDQE